MKNKIKNIYIFVLLAALVSFTACDEYLDVNSDPTRIAPDQVTLASLLPGCIEAVSLNHYRLAFNHCQIAQQLAGAAGGGADAHSEIRLPAAWTGTYLTALTNLNNMVKLAEQQNAPHYAGVAKVLMATNLGLATDTWGDIPFSEAFNITKLTPGFDSQESVYNAIQRLLDEAIVSLNAPTSAFSPSAADDLALAGNRVRWVRVARALKARYALHLSGRGGTAAATNALTALSAGAMTANTEDLQLIYNTRNFNPWHSNVALANNTGNFTVRHSSQLIDAMNGRTFGVFDPRLPIIAGRPATATQWNGNENGSGTGGNCDLTVNTWHSKVDAPILMMTFAEQKFIEAEAEFLKNGGTPTSVGSTKAAYDAYLAGITASMQKLGVADTARTRYLADLRVAVGADKLKLSHIMVEKSKAIFLHAEAWTDMRRYNYNDQVYPELTLPRNHNPELQGQWIQRAIYPLDEFSRNGENVRRAQKALTDKMWWAM